MPLMRFRSNNVKFKKFFPNAKSDKAPTGSTTGSLFRIIIRRERGLFTVNVAQTPKIYTLIPIQKSAKFDKSIF